MKFIYLLFIGLLAACSVHDKDFVRNAQGYYRTVENDVGIIITGDGDIVNEQTQIKIYDFKYAESSTKGVYEYPDADLFVPVVINGADLMIGKVAFDKKSVDFSSVTKYAVRK